MCFSCEKSSRLLHALQERDQAMVISERYKAELEELKNGIEFVDRSAALCKKRIDELKEKNEDLEQHLKEYRIKNLELLSDLSIYRKGYKSINDMIKEIPPLQEGKWLGYVYRIECTVRALVDIVKSMDDSQYISDTYQLKKKLFPKE